MVPLTIPEVERLHGQRIHHPIVAYAGRIGSKPVAFGGLIWRDGRCELFVDILNRRKVSALAVVRWARRMLRMARQFGEHEVWCLRDEGPSSAKLLTLVGMRMDRVESVIFNDGRVADKELWKWQA